MMQSLASYLLLLLDEISVTRYFQQLHLQLQWFPKFIYVYHLLEYYYF